MKKKEDELLDTVLKGEPPWKRLERKTLVKCPWLTHYADRIVCSGKKEIEFHALSYPMPVVGVLLIDAGNRVLLTKQYRYMVESFDWELPAGNADPGEALEEAARRETLEETGYAMKSCRLVKTFYPQIGRSDHCFSLFVGEGPEKVSEKYDEGETFGLKWFTAEEARALCKSDRCRDGFCLLALSMWFAGELGVTGAL